MQRRPHSSLRPKNSEVPRWAQCSPTSPMRPLVSRKATSSSPSRRTRACGESGAGISSDKSAGSQYRRISSPIGVPGPVRVSSSFCSLGSISISPYSGSSIERRRRKYLFIGEPCARHPLLVIVGSERVDRSAVSADAVFPRIAPARKLLLRALAKIDDGKSAAVAENVVVGGLLRLLEGGVELAGELGVRAVELLADHDDMHRRVNAGLAIELLVLFDEIGEEPLHLRAILEHFEQLRIGNIRYERVDLAVEQAVGRAFLAVDVMNAGFFVVVGKNFLHLRRPSDLRDIDAVAMLQQPAHPDADRGAILARADRLAFEIFRRSDARAGAAKDKWIDQIGRAHV